MTVLSLTAGRLAVDLAPASGGSIARFRTGEVDLLRPMAEADIASGRGNNSACYPLVPFSNRIANGRLAFDGKEIVVAPNWPGQRHPMHGDGWKAAWTVTQSDAHAAHLVYEHDGRTGWPFRYRARQRFRLDDGERLAVEIGVENLEDHPVPAGIGLHPFFAREPDTHLAFGARAVWRADAQILPVERIDVPAAWNFAGGRVLGDAALDNCFDGWDGEATIVWPRRGLRLRLEATPPLRHLVVYTPTGRPFFCAEPVSHANGQLGRTRLAAGATLAGEIVFRISHL